MHKVAPRTLSQPHPEQRLSLGFLLLLAAVGPFCPWFLSQEPCVCFLLCVGFFIYLFWTVRCPYREQAVSVLRHEEKSCRADPTWPEPCPCCSLHEKMQARAKCLLGSVCACSCGGCLRCKGNARCFCLTQTGEIPSFSL